MSKKHWKLLWGFRYPELVQLCPVFHCSCRITSNPLLPPFFDIPDGKIFCKSWSKSRYILVFSRMYIISSVIHLFWHRPTEFFHHWSTRLLLPLQVHQRYYRVLSCFHSSKLFVSSELFLTGSPGLRGLFFWTFSKAYTLLRANLRPNHDKIYENLSQSWRSSKIHSD